MIDPEIIITTRAAQAARDRELVAAAERMARAAQPAAAPSACVMGIEAGKYRYLTQREIEDGAASGIVPLFAVSAAAPSVEQIEAIIQSHSDKPEISMSRWSRAAREIAARISAPAVPAEIVERAKRLPIYPTPDALRKWLADPHALDWHDRKATIDAMGIVRDLAAQSAPAPDPRAVELTKRLPDDLADWTNMQQWNWVVDAAAYVRRVAAERGA